MKEDKGCRSGMNSKDPNGNRRKKLSVFIWGNTWALKNRATRLRTWVDNTLLKVIVLLKLVNS